MIGFYKKLIRPLKADFTKNPKLLQYLHSEKIISFLKKSVTQDLLERLLFQLPKIIKGRPTSANHTLMILHLSP